MLRHYLSTSARHLWRNKVVSFINLFGLGLGFYCFLLLSFYVSSERNFDRSHGNVYRLLQHIEEDDGSRVAATIGPQVGLSAKSQFPEIEAVTLLAHLGRLTVGNDPAKRSYEELYAIDSSFFEVFDLQLTAGSQQALFTSPNAILLPEKQAQKYFAEEQAVGQSLYTSILEGEVAAVMQDFPANTHLDGEFLLPFQTAAGLFQWWDDYVSTNWHRNAFVTYFKTRKDADPEALAQKITRLAGDNWPQGEPFRHTFSLQPVEEIHLHPGEVEGEINKGKGSAFYIKAFSWLALVLLLVAAFNFAGLLNVSFLGRASEVGIRKVVGAGRRQLLAQVFTESFVLAALAFLLATVALQLSPGWAERLLGKPFGWVMISWQQLLLIVGVGLTAICLSALYPGWLIGGWDPIKAIKGEKASSGNRWTVRQALTFLQFAAAVALIACTLVFYRQLHYLQNKELGFDMEGLAVIDINSDKLRDSYPAIKEAFAQAPGIQRITTSTRVPGEWKFFPIISAHPEQLGPEQEESMIFIGADEDFLDTYQMQLLAGRNFHGRPGDSTTVLLNEAAVEALGLKEPVGQWLEMSSINWSGDIEEFEEPYRFQVAGVVEDFHFEGFRRKIRPLAIGYTENPVQNIDYYTLRADMANWAETLAHLKAVNQQFDEANPLEYTLLDERFHRFYEEDLLRSRMLSFFSLVAIVIACLGLFVMVSYSLRQRTKEIGIRKILGASVEQIVGLISVDFLKIVLLAFGIGLPAAWWVMQAWLQEFAYRIDLSWWVFALAAIVALAIAFLTVSLQSVRAALVNPVDTLRSE